MEWEEVETLRLTMRSFRCGEECRYPTLFEILASRFPIQGRAATTQHHLRSSLAFREAQT